MSALGLEAASMTGMLVCLSAAVVGVDYGWQPVAGGGVEYIIQIEPQMLERLKAGEDLFSDLPPQTAGIRGYRITVGTAPLPHQGQPLPTNVGTPVGKVNDRSRAAAAPPAELLDIDGPLPGPVFGPAEPRTADHRSSSSTAVPSTVRKPNEAKRLADKPKSENVKASHQVRRAHAADRQTAKTDEPSKKRSHKTQSAASAPAPEPEKSSGEKAAEPTRPSVAFILGLSASMIGNAFLLWVAVSQRSSYRSLAKLVGPSVLGNHE